MADTLILLFVLAVSGSLFPLGVAGFRRKQIAGSGIAKPVFWWDFPLGDVLIWVPVCVLFSYFGYLIHDGKSIDPGITKYVGLPALILPLVTLLLFFLLRIAGLINHWFYVRNTILRFGDDGLTASVDRNGFEYRFSVADVVRVVERPFLSDSKAPVPLGDFRIYLVSGESILLSRLQPGLEVLKGFLKGVNIREEEGAYFFISGFLKKPVDEFLEFAGRRQLGKLAFMLFFLPFVWGVNLYFQDEKKEDENLKPATATLYSVTGPVEQGSGRTKKTYFKLNLRFEGRDYLLNVNRKQYRNLGNEFYVSLFYNPVTDQLQFKSYNRSIHYFVVGSLVFVAFSIAIAFIYRLGNGSQDKYVAVSG